MEQPKPQDMGIGNPPPTDSNVRYVLSGTPAGWTAMAQTMRDYDEDKVQNTKEDIDTLLTFAGLFSAALTAFLVESYQTLLPDPNSQISATSQQSLVVMQQMYLQVLNGSSQPLIALANPVPPPFEPSPNDIRVNVLWFASLTFSLMTASFAILVKQWLREYMAVDYPSPQARLRIRHYRYPQLATWRVFEIAAALPLLLQLALALFFIGLCYFTASVHKSVGHTTLPLVAGWALCFTVAIFLPVFLPRCPYKTTLLKSVHTRAAHALQRLSLWLSSQYPPRPVHDLGIDHSAGSDRDFPSSLLNKIRQLLPSIHNRLEDHRSRHDERLIITRDVEDIKILGSVDAIQLNDSLLTSTILESLQQIHQPKWIDIIDLVYTLLNHRGCQYEFSRGNLNALPPLHFDSLTREAYTGIIDIVSRYVPPTLGDDDAANATEAIRHTWIILLSKSHYPYSKAGTMALRNLVHFPNAGSIWCSILSMYDKHPNGQSMLLRSLWQQLDDSALSPLSFEKLIDGLKEGLLGMRVPRGQWATGGAGYPLHEEPWPLSRISMISDLEIIILAADGIHVRNHNWSLVFKIGDLWNLAGAIANQGDDDVFQTFYSAMANWFYHRRSLELMSFIVGGVNVKTQDVVDICNAIRILRDKDRTDPDSRVKNADSDDVICAAWKTSLASLNRMLTRDNISRVLRLAALFVHLSPFPYVWGNGIRTRHSSSFEVWRETCQSFADALYIMFGITPPHGGYLSSHTALPSSHTTPLSLYSMLTFIPQCSQPMRSEVTALIRGCLEYIQRDTLEIPYIYRHRHLPIPKEYKEWEIQDNMPHLFAYSTFTNNFIKILGRIYFATQYPDLDVDEEQRFFRLRKLGVLDEVRRTLTGPDPGSHAHHTEELDIVVPVPVPAAKFYIISSYHTEPEPMLDLPLAADNGLNHESEIAERRRRILEAVTARLDRQRGRNGLGSLRPTQSRSLAAKKWVTKRAVLN